MLFEYLERGVLAGVLAGLAYGVYMATVANPLIEYMEGLEDDHGHGHGHGAEQAHEHAHAVTETTTAVVSVGSGVLWGVLLGGLFAVAFYLLEPALPGTRSVKSVVLAGAGFLTVSVAPWLALPPVTPGAEQAMGINARLVLYAGMMVVGALVAAAAVLAYTRTAPRNRLLGVAVGALPVVALVAIVPTVAPTTVDYGGLSGDLVSAFQGLTVLSQAALWLLVAGGFSWLLGYAGPTDDTATLEEEVLAEP